MEQGSFGLSWYAYTKGPEGIVLQPKIRSAHASNSALVIRRADCTPDRAAAWRGRSPKRSFARGSGKYLHHIVQLKVCMLGAVSPKL